MKKIVKNLKNQSGLERTSYYILNQGLACNAVTGNTNLTNVSFGEGQFTVTDTEYHPTSTTLTVNISNVAETIPVASLTGYANIGRVQINSEYINYYGTSTNNVTCGSLAPCLTHALRGQAGSIASSHLLGDSVNQNMCVLQSVSGVPNLTFALGKRTVDQAILFATGPNWIMGNKSSGETILNWDGTKWERYPISGDIPNKNLWDVTQASDNTAWAVGEKQGGNALFIHWNGSTWSRVTPAASVSNKNFNSVLCQASNDCWAVGDNASIAYYNGSQWVGVAPGATVPNTNLNAISFVAGGLQSSVKFWRENYN